jgi:hypothetical protein
MNAQSSTSDKAITIPCSGKGFLHLKFMGCRTQLRDMSFAQFAQNKPRYPVKRLCTKLVENKKNTSASGRSVSRQR